MWSSLARLFQPNPIEDQASALYITLASQSRKTFFYTTLQVPDTIDGRHELLVLHLFLLMRRLQQEGTTYEEFCRALAEIHFSNMDLSLRELGVGDTGVGKRIRKMAEAFFGRMHAYEDALGSREAFTESLRRNVYGTVEVDDVTASKLADYALNTLKFLQSLKPETILAKDFAFNPLPA